MLMNLLRDLFILDYRQICRRKEEIMRHLVIFILIPIAWIFLYTSVIHAQENNNQFGGVPFDQLDEDMQNMLKAPLPNPTKQAVVPIGTILPYAGEIGGSFDYIKEEGDPVRKWLLKRHGWVPCDGSWLPFFNKHINDYKDLFQVIKCRYGCKWNDSQTSVIAFRVPDYRGRFLRGVDMFDWQDDLSNNDPGTRQRMFGDHNSNNIIIEYSEIKNQDTINDDDLDDVVGTIQEYGTKKPQNSFSMGTPGRHPHKSDNVEDHNHFDEINEPKTKGGHIHSSPPKSVKLRKGVLSYISPLSLPHCCDAPTRVCLPGQLCVPQDLCDGGDLCYPSNTPHMTVVVPHDVDGGEDYDIPLHDHTVSAQEGTHPHGIKNQGGHHHQILKASDTITEDQIEWVHGGHNHLVGGGDIETRSVNANVNWIIKVWEEPE